MSTGKAGSKAQGEYEFWLKTIDFDHHHSNFNCFDAASATADVKDCAAFQASGGCGSVPDTTAKVASYQGRESSDRQKDRYRNSFDVEENMIDKDAWTHEHYMPVLAKTYCQRTCGLCD